MKKSTEIIYENRAVFNDKFLVMVEQRCLRFCIEENII